MLHYYYYRTFNKINTILNKSNVRHIKVNQNFNEIKNDY